MYLDSLIIGSRNMEIYPTPNPPKSARISDQTSQPTNGKDYQVYSPLRRANALSGESIVSKDPVCNGKTTTTRKDSKRFFVPNAYLPAPGGVSEASEKKGPGGHEGYDFRGFHPPRSQPFQYHKLNTARQGQTEQAQCASFQPSLDDEPDSEGSELEPEILSQPATIPISHEQLVVEVKGIYAGLVMIEAKCIDVDEKQTEDAKAAKEGNPQLTTEQWQALMALHKTLIHEHHDFFLASQHPSASPALSRLAAKYNMPARMWCHGIHAFLEHLRHRLPGSLDHMLAFIYFAYSMLSLLYESVPTFDDTWIECLGDLARYRMAIEGDNIKDREVWAGVAEFWYHSAANHSPEVGRLNHHLAVLARPHTLQQLSLYFPCLTHEAPFESANESIMTLFDSLFNPPSYDHKKETRNINILPLTNVLLNSLRSLGGMFGKERGMDLILSEIPWPDIAEFVKSLAKLEESASTGAGEKLPKPDLETGRPLPEDYIIRGQLWSKDFFPQRWFSSPVMDDEERTHLPRRPKTSKAHGIGKRLLIKVSKIKRGLASFVNGTRLSVIADTGAAANVISATYAKQRNMEIDTSSSSFRLGNSSLVDSLGTVTIDYAFAEEPSNMFKLVCHVIPHCIYDLILGNSFLTATETMSKYRRRLTECVFSIANVFHLGYLGNSQQILEGTLANKYLAYAIPDTGAERNVMDLQYVAYMTSPGPCSGEIPYFTYIYLLCLRNRYAIEHEFEICHEPEDWGYLQFADGTYQETVGRVHTYWTFQSGERIPITFEVLENCCSELIIGEDILWDYNVFEVYASSIITRSEASRPYSLAPFGWENGWQKKVFVKRKPQGELLPCSSLDFEIIL